MLNIFLGKMDDAIYFPPVYFDNQYDLPESFEWLILKSGLIPGKEIHEILEEP